MDREKEGGLIDGAALIRLEIRHRQMMSGDLRFCCGYTLWFGCSPTSSSTVHAGHHHPFYSTIGSTSIDIIILLST